MKNDRPMRENLVEIHPQPSHSKKGLEGFFDPEELDNSFPFGPDRTLRGPNAMNLLNHCISKIDKISQRKRARKGDDDLAHKRTAEAVVANLIAGALNRMDDSRFIAIGLNRNDYVGTELSHTSLQRMINSLAACGLIEGRRGFFDRNNPQYEDRGRRTRIRATEEFRELIQQFNVTPRALAIADAKLIRLKKPAATTSAEVPLNVECSRNLLSALNSKLASADINLPEHIWTQMVSRPLVLDEHADSDAVRRYRRYAGDRAATSLYRVFNGDWEAGGRLYGGWWMSVGKEDRKSITINGNQTVELDYSRLHPTILYAEQGLPLDFDPYILPQSDDDAIRKLGKRTFNRLLNTTDTGKRFNALPGDRQFLPKGMKFATFRERLIALHGPIAHYFKTGVGLRLQKADSDIALSVLRILHGKGIIALPIHDSFIVNKEYKDILIQAMTVSFKDRYPFDPIIH